jgi:hypothetical protein
MQGSDWQSGGLFDVLEIAPGLIQENSVYGLLAAQRETIFPPEMFEDLVGSDRGRPSVPGPVMAVALVLQALESRSDRGAAEALTYDLRWKAAAGLGIDARAFHHTVFTYWRKRIAKSADPDRISAVIAQIAAETGVLRGKTRRVVDSTILDDAVARQDTVTMIQWQVGRIGRLFPSLAEWIGCLPGRAWYADRSKPDIDWKDPIERDHLVSVLVNDAIRIVERAGEAIEQMAQELGAELSKEMDADQVAAKVAEAMAPYRDAVGLLALVAGQDVEPAPGSDGTDGRWRIARKVAADRVISVVDPQARHARKTRSDKRDGYKAHVVAEPDTGLVTDARLTQAAGPGTSDGEVGADMVAHDQAVAAGQVDQVLGDAAYSSAHMLRTCDQLGVQALVKPQPLVPAVPGGYTIDDFEVDTQAGTVTCPGAFTVALTKSGNADFTGFCHRCVLRAGCTKARNGREVHLGPDQLRQRQQRHHATTEAFAQDYRQHRPMAERTIAWMTRGARRLAYRGQAKNNAWWRLRAAAVNLKRLTAMGLQHTDQGWNVPDNPFQAPQTT